jgi:hypothetical protein
LTMQFLLLTHKAFPYPVLRPYCDDYQDVEFQATVEFTVSTDSIDADISYALSSEELMAEIEKGNAKYVSVVSCRETYLRTVLTSTDGKIAKSFNPGNLRGEVRVDPYIVATKVIAGFISPDINPEFGNGPFTFAPGEVLAQEETQVFYIDRDLFKPVTAVFDLVKNDALSGGEWKVGLDENHVQIEVSPQLKESIDNARNDKTNKVILINSVLFAAVMHALQRLKEGKDAYEGKRWAEVMKGQLHNNGWDLDAHDPYVLAQRLMKYPLAMLDTYVFKEKD